MISLAALEQLANAATPGPWVSHWDTMRERREINAPNKVGVADDVFDHADAAFIAKCDPQTILALIRVAKEAMRHIERELIDDLTVTEPGCELYELDEALAPFREEAPA